MCDINMLLKIRPLSAETLKGQKKCCSNKCVNCPYHPKGGGGKVLVEDLLDMFCSPKCSQIIIEKGDCECHNELNG